MDLTLHVAAMPTPRPRFVVRGKFVSTYYPKPYVAYADALRDMIAEALAEAGAQPLEGPLAVDIEITLERPKTTKLPTPKPDVDNYAKGIMDAMTKAGVWADDSQVSDLYVSKRWGEADLVVVRIHPIPELVI